MYLPISIHVDLVDRPTGDGLDAIVQLVGEDGTIYDLLSSGPLAAGSTIDVGPLYSACELESVIAVRPTPTDRRPGIVVTPRLTLKPAAAGQPVKPK